MRIRLIIAFSLVSVVAVLVSTSITLYLGGRRTDAETIRRLRGAVSFSQELIAADRDRNLSDALEIASRPTVQRLVSQHDASGLNRLMPAFRQNQRNDMLAIYARDGALLAGDSNHVDLLDRPVSIVRTALGGVSQTSLVLDAEHHLALAAAAPIIDADQVIGAVVALDTIDERFAARINRITGLTIAIVSEHQQFAATETLTTPVLNADQWQALRNRGSIRATIAAGDRPQVMLAQPLTDGESRLVAALMIGRPEAALTPIELSDYPLLIMLTLGLMAVLCGLSLAIGRWLSGRMLALATPPGGTLATITPSLPELTRPLLSVVGPEIVESPAPQLEATDTIALPGLFVDRSRRRVEINHQTIALTPTEFDLLWALVSEAGRVVTRDALLERLRGEGWHAEPGLLDTHISNLRRKIEPTPSRPHFILTVRGVGYRLADLTNELIPPEVAAAASSQSAGHH